jgi:hypothetical protein
MTVSYANNQRQYGDTHKFSVSTGDGRFSVARESGSALPVSIDCSLEGDEIAVCRGPEIKFRATIKINNEGRCLLRVDDEELEAVACSQNGAGGFVLR